MTALRLQTPQWPIFTAPDTTHRNLMRNSRHTSNNTCAQIAGSDGEKHQQECAVPLLNFGNICQ